MKFYYLTLIMAFPLFGWSQTRDNAGASGAEGAISGFFDTYNPVNYPAGAAGWWHLLDVRHTNQANNYAMQFAGSFYDQNLYFRKTDNWGARPWQKVVTEENGKVNIEALTFAASASMLNAGNSGPTTGGIAIQANTGGRLMDKGAQLEFVIPANQDGSNPWGQGRILVVAGNPNSFNAVGKMILGTRRMFNKIGAGQEWYYGDDMVIDGVGNIGMGTLTPVEKLSVNGKIRAHEVKVETSNWPDFVFEEGYKIGKLEELDSYIKIHKHLPDMPSAKEVEANGISLGEMVKLQQQKIEELSLYLIQQAKIAQGQSDDILRLQAEIKKIKSQQQK